MPREWGAKLPGHRTQLWGDMGFKDFRPTLAASCPNLAPGTRGATPPCLRVCAGGAVTPDGWVPSFCQHFRWHPLLCCIQCAPAAALKLAGGRLPLTSPSNACPCDLAIIYKILILCRRVGENLRGEGLKTCSRPTASGWASSK